MHLHDHARAQLLGFQPALHRDHRQLDQIGRRALHRRIDRGAFGAGTARTVRRIDLRQPQAAAEHGLHVAARLGRQARFVHVLLHAREARKVAVDVVGRRRTLDLQVRRQPESAHAIDQAEVDHLGVAALLGLHLFRRNAEDLGGRGAVDVLAFGKGAQHRFVARDVRHDAQLDLRIVGRDDHAARRRNKGFADAAAFGGAHGNVLQIRIVRGQAPGDRHRLRVVGMHAAGGLVDHLRQLVGIGRLQLGHAAVFQQHFRQRVILGQLLQHFFVGRWCASGGLLDDRQLQLAEEDFADLLRRAEVELAAGQFIGLLLELHQAGPEFARLLVQLLDVDQHAVALDLLQHDLGRQLDLFVDMGQAGILEHVRQHGLVQAQGDVGILGRVFLGALELHLVEADHVGALAAHVHERNRGVAEVAHRHRVHVVRLVRFEHIRLQQGVVHDALQRDPMVVEDVHVVLQVLAQLGLGRIFQPRTHALQHLFARQLLRHAGIAVRQRDVSALACFHRQRDADHLRRHRFQRGGFGIDRSQLGRIHQGQPLVELLPGRHEFVLALDDRHARQGVLRAFRRVQARGGRRSHAGALRQFAQHGLEAIALEELAQGVLVFWTADQAFLDRHHVVHQVAIGLHGDQLTALGQPFQCGAQVFAHGAADAVRVFHHAVERAVQGQPFQRRLRAALVHAGHVVDGVADQGQVIDDAVRRHAELGEHAGFVELFVTHRVDEHDLVVDQLRQVLVAGGNDGVHALGGGLHGQGADHVVGFHAFDHQDRPAEVAHRFVDRGDLLAQVFRHRCAGRLVLGVHVVAEGFTLGVEYAGDVGGRVVGAQAAQHVDHAVHGAGRETVGAAQVGQGVVGAVEVAGTVNQEQGILHRKFGEAGRGPKWEPLSQNPP